MQIVNLSAEPLGKLHSWMPHDLTADQVVFLPDACPGKSPLPTGTAVLTRQADWRRFAVSDCGCGMRLLKSNMDVKDLDLERWSSLADLLRANKGGLGDLGGGNHFLDAIAPYEDGPLYFLIHTGSRNESGHVDALVDNPAGFDNEFDRVVRWAADNRASIHEKLEVVFGKTDLLLDLPHNTYEQLADGCRSCPQGFGTATPRRTLHRTLPHVWRRRARKSQRQSCGDSELNESWNWPRNVEKR
jgi:hypothetical protein